MTSINCPECKKEISDEAIKCPGCGKTVVELLYELSERKFRVRMLLVILFLVGASALIQWYFF
jgi:hypothetical protein|tara:strand:- start:710 stop:898 length:189 start_codon:yes stop_codon:yes gene_type:complete